MSVCRQCSRLLLIHNPACHLRRTAFRSQDTYKADGFPVCHSFWCAQTGTICTFFIHKMVFSTPQSYWHSNNCKHFSLLFLQLDSRIAFSACRKAFKAYNTLIQCSIQPISAYFFAISPCKMRAHGKKPVFRHRCYIGGRWKIWCRWRRGV